MYGWGEKGEKEVTLQAAYLCLSGSAWFGSAVTLSKTVALTGRVYGPAERSRYGVAFELLGGYAELDAQKPSELPSLG